MSAKSFHAKLGAEGHALFFEVPFDVKKEFGKARPPVRVSVNGHSYRSTVSVYGGKYYLPVRREHREAIGLKQGDIVRVTVAPDTAARNGSTSAGAFRCSRQKPRRQNAVAEAQLYPQEGTRRCHPPGQEARDS